MLPETIQSIDDIDWALLCARAAAQKTRRKKSAKDWDERAQGFARRVQETTYTSQIMERLPLTKETTVLDVGSGPGTLSLPIAERAAQVTALDFSGEMLKILRRRAEEKNLNNIQTLSLAWEDDWQQAGIAPHDIALASRSLAVDDLEAALCKLNTFARKQVVITDRIGAGPMEPEAFAAVGIEFKPGPDYIYTLNILHKMNIVATMEVIEFDRKKNYPTIDDAIASFLWMFNELTSEQTKRLQGYIESISRKEPDGSLTVTRQSPPRWALISWKKEQ